METDIQIKIVFLFMLTESDKQKQWEGRKEGISGCSCKTSKPVLGRKAKEERGICTHNLEGVVNTYYTRIQLPGSMTIIKDMGGKSTSFLFLEEENFSSSE